MRRALAVLSWLVLTGLVVQADLVLPQQTQPPLDISGIAIIQAIPVGVQEGFTTKKATKVLHSIANLAVMQMDLERFTIEAEHPLTKEKELIPGGEFGRILRHEILFFNPKEEGVGVMHLAFDGDPRNPKPDDIDKFRLSINGRDTYLYLVRAYGRPDKGFPEWGVKGMVFLMDIMEGTKVVKVIRKELGIRSVSGKWSAYYKLEELAPDGTPLKPPLVFNFVQGNPNPVSGGGG